MPEVASFRNYIGSHRPRSMLEGLGPHVLQTSIASVILWGFRAHQFSCAALVKIARYCLILFKRFTGLKSESCSSVDAVTRDAATSPILQLHFITNGTPAAGLAYTATQTASSRKTMGPKSNMAPQFAGHCGTASGQKLIEFR